MTYSGKSFSDIPTKLGPKMRYVDIDQSIIIEKFKVGIPTDFDPEETYGLMVYNSPSDRSPLPYWDEVLPKRKLLVISPLKCGNDQEVARRLGSRAWYSLHAARLQDRPRTNLCGGPFRWGTDRQRLGFLSKFPK